MADSRERPRYNRGMDKLDPVRRSQNMARIRSKDTGPELRVRRAAHALGYRFRLHRKDLPGSPDLVFPKLRKVVFVHGCFWHRHRCCQDCSDPKSRQDYWLPKFARTVQRDSVAMRDLRKLGWQPYVIWDCETPDSGSLKAKLRALLRR